MSKKNLITLWLCELLCYLSVGNKTFANFLIALFLKITIIITKFFYNFWIKIFHKDWGGVKIKVNIFRDFCGWGLASLDGDQPFLGGKFCLMRKIKIYWHRIFLPWPHLGQILLKFHYIGHFSSVNISARKALNVSSSITCLTIRPFCLRITEGLRNLV